MADFCVPVPEIHLALVEVCCGSMDARRALCFGFEQMKFAAVNHVKPDIYFIYFCCGRGSPAKYCDAALRKG